MKTCKMLFFAEARVTRVYPSRVKIVYIPENDNYLKEDYVENALTTRSKMIPLSA